MFERFSISSALPWRTSACSSCLCFALWSAPTSTCAASPSLFWTPHLLEGLGCSLQVFLRVERARSGGFDQPREMRELVVESLGGVQEIGRGALLAHAARSLAPELFTLRSKTPRPSDVRG